MPQRHAEDGDGDGLVQEGQRDRHLGEQVPDAEDDLYEDGAAQDQP